MLPSAKSYLVKGGFSPSVAAYVLIGCFLAGVLGIQIVSHFLHHYIPSNVVDCNHTHSGEEESDDDHDSSAEHRHQNGNTDLSEQTPLLSTNDCSRTRSGTNDTNDGTETTFLSVPSTRRPSLQKRLTARVATFVLGAKAMCDENGPCHGYSDPCGQECFKAISRSPTRARRSSAGPPRTPGLHRASTQPFSYTMHTPLGSLEENANLCHSSEQTHEHLQHHAPDRGRQSRRISSSYQLTNGSKPSDDLESGKQNLAEARSVKGNPPNDATQAHHHHVPSNAFLSIGLQTSIAIALHKLPEGFITFATNHANAKLGFAVFMALFIHNITEGFAMALPLYLALHSRWKAMFWSSLLGGISQPLGAGVAAIWFHIAGRGEMAPGERIYGCMFAVTAGIMSSVALQLFSESLGLTHNRNLCIAFAFIGMGILGVSFALTAD